MPSETTHDETVATTELDCEALEPADLQAVAGGWPMMQGNGGGG